MEEERLPPPAVDPTSHGNAPTTTTTTTTNTLEPPQHLRVKTRNDGDNDDHEQHFPEHENDDGHDDEDTVDSKMTSTMPFSLSDGRSETYVVQIPRDLVYRVPPPQNAKVLEEKKLTGGQNNKNRSKCCLWACTNIALVGIILGIIIGVAHITHKPQLPEFSVSGFSIKNSQPNSGNGNPNYQVTLQATNTNSRFEVVYNDGGKTSLQLGQNLVAQGGYPTSTQAAQQSNEVQFILDGSGKLLPSQIEKGMHDPKFKATVPLQLNLELPIEHNSWIRKSKGHLIVTCNFTVSSLAKAPQVLDQSCQMSGNSDSYDDSSS